MLNVQMEEHKQKLKEWLPLIIAAMESELSIRVWCREHNIKASQMYYWMDAMRKDGILASDNSLLVDPKNFDGTIPSQNNAAVSPKAKEKRQECMVELKSEKESALSARSVRKTDPGPAGNDSPGRDTVTDAPYRTPSLMVRYENYYLYIGDDVNESALGKVIRVLRNA